jgi:ssDNA-binding Zn-finger/Zn-ribbon topoisomerase 1
VRDTNRRTVFVRCHRARKCRWSRADHSLARRGRDAAHRCGHHRRHRAASAHGSSAGRRILSL